MLFEFDSARRESCRRALFFRVKSETPEAESNLVVSYHRGLLN